jgi:adenosylcobinamide kinase/adenosylcobinamide-phosphate guanylyltransferase
VKEIILVTGGCRSGKSRFALEYANKHFRKKIFLATATALDDEMKERIRAHQNVRGSDWTTIEEPTEVARALTAVEPQSDLILIDCLTLWLSNLVMMGKEQAEILSETQAMTELIQEIPQSLIAVTNESGCGIVPANKVSREFRDLLGMVNQMLAACSDVVVWTVVGLPQVIKGELGRRNDI